MLLDLTNKQQSAYQMYPILNIYQSFPNTHTFSFSLLETCNLGCLPTCDPLAEITGVSPSYQAPQTVSYSYAPGSNERPHIACGHYNLYTSVWLICKVEKNCTSRSISLNGRTLRVRLLRFPKGGLLLASLPAHSAQGRGREPGFAEMSV